MAFTGRLKHLMKVYGKVGVAVHVSVSCATFTGLYVAINNNVDVDSLLRRVGISPTVEAPPAGTVPNPSEVLRDAAERDEPRNRTAELVASSGGALALAVICNKALMPLRIPITVALTPPVSRALQRWRLIKG